jgi:H+-translocating NAD(P) transhydrogenase subunit alpha
VSWHQVGFPKESRPLERRCAVTPESVGKLVARGLTVSVEAGIGLAAGYPDSAYVERGAKVVVDAWALPVVVKVRPPIDEEVSRLASQSVLVSLIQPERHQGLIEALAAKRVTVLALEKIPRVTRAQKMDVLSSQANLAGYRAVVEAAAQLQRSFGPQVTAAGSTPPAKVLVIGAGVAGLAAVGAARALGADVRAFDTRAAAREQVESLGATFLEVDIKESGDGGGGYGKVMSPEFIAAEMALFTEQAKQVDVVITTALVPGLKAPTLLPLDVVEHLKPGSVVVDLAAEQGGNCALTKPDVVVEHQGIKVIGYTDLTSRMATVASRFFAMNVVNLFEEFGATGPLVLQLENDVVRPALLLHEGQALPALPPKPASTAKAPPLAPHAPPPDVKPVQVNIMKPTRRAWGSTVGGLFGVGLLFFLGRFAPSDFLQHSTVFVLACFIGWQVIWSVSPSLHTPLMAVTNAISGIIIIGGMLQISAGFDVASILGAVAVLFAAINIAGGFFVTHRMLKMFHRGDAAVAQSKGGHR